MKDFLVEDHDTGRQVCSMESQDVVPQFLVKISNVPRQYTLRVKQSWSCRKTVGTSVVSATINEKIAKLEDIEELYDCSRSATSSCVGFHISFACCRLFYSSCLRAVGDPAADGFVSLVFCDCWVVMCLRPCFCFFFCVARLWVFHDRQDVDLAPPLQLCVSAAACAKHHDPS